MLQNELYGILGIGAGLAFFSIIVIWSLIWQAWSLWIAARQGEKIWFIVLLIINTAGILNIIYIFYISQDATAEYYKKRIFGRKRNTNSDPADDIESQPEKFVETEIQESDSTELDETQDVQEDSEKEKLN